MKLFSSKSVARLEKKVASALGIVTKTIEKLEKVNAEHEILKAEIGDEIARLTTMHINLHASVKQNDNVIKNFKKLLN